MRQDNYSKKRNLWELLESRVPGYKSTVNTPDLFDDSAGLCGMSPHFPWGSHKDSMQTWQSPSMLISWWQNRTSLCYVSFFSQQDWWHLIQGQLQASMCVAPLASPDWRGASLCTAFVLLKRLTAGVSADLFFSLHNTAAMYTPPTLYLNSCLHPPHPQYFPYSLMCYLILVCDYGFVLYKI